MAKAEIRNRVRDLRSEHDGMTQQQLADHCGCTRQTIIALEAGKYDWSHIAMQYWPNRVEEVCGKDKSIAIAHDRLDLYEEDVS